MWRDFCWFYHKQFYPLKVKRVYTQNFQSHHVVTPCSICFWNIMECESFERVREKDVLTVGGTWKQKIEYLCCDDDQQQEKKNIEKFIQFERTVSSSRDHSIISAGVWLSSFLSISFPSSSVHTFVIEIKGGKNNFLYEIICNF